MGSCISRSCVSVQAFFRWGFGPTNGEKTRRREDDGASSSADECVVGLKHACRYARACASLLSGKQKTLMF